MLLDLYDEINIIKIISKQDKIQFIGQFKKDINIKNNSITRSLVILRKYGLINRKNRYKIVINKKIPVFAGLGGGTSNAFFLIKYFLKNEINEKLIKIFEKEIGSDFRLFFYKQSFQKNLKKIIKFKKQFNFNLILVYPNIYCSTKQVYSKVKKFNLPLKYNLSKIQYKNKYLQFLKSEKNDLQDIVEKKHLKVKKILNLLRLQKKKPFFSNDWLWLSLFCSFS